jgi:hypothetical protein
MTGPRPIIFGLRIILRKYLTTASLARAKFGAVSRACQNHRTEECRHYVYDNNSILTRNLNSIFFSL